MNQRDDGPAMVPGSIRPVDTDQLLSGVEDDVTLLDELSTQDQVPVYDRVHTALADTLARTADTGGQPGSGHPGA